jgi:glyoxylase-like metal-dependent hydrolase (beta-lactamase superfamily II)
MAFPHIDPVPDFAEAGKPPAENTIHRPCCSATKPDQGGGHGGQLDYIVDGDETHASDMGAQTTTGAPIITAFFDEPTNTVSYLVADPATKHAAAIDPVLEYDHKSGEVDTRLVEAMLKTADARGYVLDWALETQAHADHLSGAPYVKAKTGTPIGIGEHTKDVQRIFRRHRVVQFERKAL